MGVENLTVRYLRTVYAPAHCRGEIGEVKDLSNYAAQPLLARGYVERVEQEQGNDDDTDLKRAATRAKGKGSKATG